MAKVSAEVLPGAGPSDRRRKTASYFDDWAGGFKRRIDSGEQQCSHCHQQTKCETSTDFTRTQALGSVVDSWSTLLGVDEFLHSQQGMRIAPVRRPQLRLKGDYFLNCYLDGWPPIQQSVDLEIVCDSPRISDISVFETGGKIPRDLEHHTLNDGSLCLGSPLRMQVACEGHTTSLLQYSKRLIDPYLYSLLTYLRTGKFPYGELPHGKAGILLECEELLGLKGKEQVMSALRLLSTRKRLANKQLCPCNCGKRLGMCSTGARLNELRKTIPRNSFADELRRLG